jgi:hypothetical protein
VRRIASFTLQGPDSGERGGVVGGELLEGAGGAAEEPDSTAATS